MRSRTAIIAALAATPALAQVTFDETGTGGFDLSDDALNPTAFVFTEGDNTIAGNVTLSNGSPTAGDRDFFTFTILDGFELVELFVNDWQPDNAGFVGINLGSTGIIPSGPDGGDTSQYILANLITGDDSGLDYLPTLRNNIATGVFNDATIGPGTYTLVIQQTGSEFSEYDLSFVIAPIPAPASAAALGLAALAATRRRR
ncbi:MAG: hypothetical protein AAGI17_00225 [Planctomycetota bacterium]